MKALLLFILLTAVALAPRAAGLRCEDAFETQKTVVANLNPKANPHWTPTSGDLFMDFRTNVGHFWITFDKAILNPRFRLLRGFEGVGVGDFHILNVNEVVLMHGDIKLGVVDLDDGGLRVPLLADFARSVAGNRLSPFRVEYKKLWKAYWDGLRGEKYELPRVLKKAQDLSLKEYEKKQKEYIAKLQDGDRFSERASVRPLSEAPPEVQAMYARSENAFHEALRGVRILDRGFRIKEEGGSKGRPRFWFLTENSSGERAVTEFKFWPDPATSVLAPQGSARERFEALSECCRPGGEPLGTFTFIENGPDRFLVRDRLKDLLDFDPSKEMSPQDKKDAEEVSVYLANKQGRWQGEQGAGRDLLKAIEQDPDAFKDMVKDFADFYGDLLRSTRQKYEESTQ